MLVLRIVTFKIPERMLEELDRYALIHGMSRSDVIRLAIQKLMREAAAQIPRYRIKRVILT